MPSQQSIDIRKTLVKDKLDDIPIAQKRQDWDDYAKSVPFSSEVVATETTLEDVLCLWLHPQQVREGYALLYLHGGGLTEGSVYTHREWTARLAQQTHLSVLSVNYSLAPEHPCPVARDEVNRVYKHLLQTGYDPAKICWAADSSGCNLALASLIALRDDGIQLPKAAVLLSPSVDLTCSGESMQSRRQLDPLVSEDVLRYCAHLYAQDYDLASPCISSLFADLTHLPEMLIQVGDHEILRSDAVRLQQAVQRADGAAQLTIWDDMWHVWQMFPELPEAQQALDEIQTFLARHVV
ncbi:MAG: alpha/beta hydrolase [Deinococcota bacterium]